MGRPKKRRREDEPSPTEDLLTGADLVDAVASSFDPNLSASFDFNPDILNENFASVSEQIPLIPDLTAQGPSLQNIQQGQALSQTFGPIAIPSEHHTV